MTAHDALITQAGVLPNEYVLIHAVGSGVGLAATQLARAWKAVPIGTARGAEKIERAREHGLVHGLVVGDDVDAIVPQIEQITEKHGVDITLDLARGSLRRREHSRVRAARAAHRSSAPSRAGPRAFRPASSSASD